MLAPTLAVVLTWFVGALVLLGCGYLSRRALIWAFRCDVEPGLQTADLWIGLAVLVAYLEVWSLFFPVNSKALIVPCGVATFAAAMTIYRIGELRLVKHRLSRVIAVGAAVGVAVLWLANLALGRPTSYDSGLYHFSAIEYAARFPAIPGLGNLSERLGAGDAHLLFVAALGNGPWHDAGFHLANGLLVALLLADITWRLAAGTTPPFTRRVMLLLVPATLVVVALEPGERLSSPSLDAPAFVLVAAGTLYLCHSLERFGVGTAMAATAAFATVAATRPFFLPALIVAAITLAIVSPCRARMFGLISVIPAAVLAAWVARQAVLSGYPLFPLTIWALPVDWRVPADVVDRVNDVIRSWARTPRKSPDAVLGSWNWLPGWLRRSITSLDVLLPFALTLFALARLRGSQVRWSLVVAVLAPLLLTLGIWFFSAPDARFVYGPLWLVPIVLLACRPLDVRVVTVCAAVVATAVLYTGWHPITKRGDGPFGSYNPPTPTVQSFKTHSGLTIRTPVGDDRCWRVQLCAPTTSPGLRLRGSDISDGFSQSS